MRIDAVNMAGSAVQQQPKASDQLVEQRKQQKQEPAAEPTAKADKIQPEEMLSQIKALTEDGLYAVRFENDKDTSELVVKVVDSETDEVIRQIPPEELLGLTKRLNDLRGNLVDTQS
ncbi:flagellar protein FlaG [Desulfuromonas thiophila]|uniref:flagellar protein FlaG n=1 Tax=Desulfuromonas thiophila TaxID=57664 RepID=UPI0029F4CA5F|nr:flagellar protein FlaG [Desulfuromonas thiophila]